MDDPRIQELRDDIARRKVQVQAAERELKELNLAGPPQNMAVRGLVPSGNKGLSQGQLSRLEGELSEVKRLIRE